MLKRNIFRLSALASVILAVYGCYPTISSSIASPRSEEVPADGILVLGVKNTLNDTSNKIGDAEFKSTELNTSCEYEDAIMKLKEIASKNGANVIRITEIDKVNALIEECVSVKAEMYFVENIDALKSLAEEQNARLAEESAREEAIESPGQDEVKDEPIKDEGEVKEKEEKVEAPAYSAIPEGADYAMLYLYRPSSYWGAIISYDVNLGDEMVYRCKNSTGTAIKVSREGIQEIWAETEVKKSVELDFKHGEEYFVKCSVGIGALVGRPAFEVVYTKDKARNEYEKAIE